MLETTHIIKGLRKEGLEVVRTKYMDEYIGTQKKTYAIPSTWAVLDKKGVAGCIEKYGLLKGPIVKIYKTAEAADKIESLACLYTEHPSEDVKFLQGEQPEAYNVVSFFGRENTFNLTPEGWVRQED